jgi:hypothetical protein
MGARAKLGILALKRPEFTVAEARLNGQEQKCSIAPSDPGIEIGSCYQSGAFFFGQEGDG